MRIDETAEAITIALPKSKESPFLRAKQFFSKLFTKEQETPIDSHHSYVATPVLPDEPVNKLSKELLGSPLVQSWQLSQEHIRTVATALLDGKETLVTVEEKQFIAALIPSKKAEKPTRLFLSALDDCLGVGAEKRVYRSTLIGASKDQAAVFALLEATGEKAFKMASDEHALMKGLREEGGENGKFIAKSHGVLYLKGAEPHLGFIMKYYPEDLLSFLERKQEKKEPIEEAEIAKITEGVLRSLCVLTDAGIVHRDIKLENFLLTASGEIRLTDFGGAVHESAYLKKTRYFGTYSYFAPEYRFAVNGLRSLATAEQSKAMLPSVTTPKIDVWAAGVMLAKLTGRFSDYFTSRPMQFFEHRVQNTLLKQGISEPPPHTFNHLIWWMLQPDPARRPTAHQALAEWHLLESLREESRASTPLKPPQAHTQPF